MKRTSVIFTVTVFTVTVLVAVSVAVSVLAAERDADREARLKAAKRYLSVVPMSMMIEESIRGFAQRVPKERRKEFMAYAKGLMRVETLEKVTLDSLVKTFTVEELNAMADFYGSPVGRSIMKKFGAYMSDVMPALQQEMIRAVRKMQQEGKLPLQGTTPMPAR
ncbi:MAG TPA: DUF2059 domain-containing protein [Nitrospirae bacterium]|nr:DUF2059 domain-containing protein [Nitrospirota bacterium]